MVTKIKDLPPDMQKEALRKAREKQQLTVKVDLNNAADVKKAIADRLKTAAVNGEPWAVREYNRLYLPKNGMQSFVHFDMPDIGKLDSRGLSKMLIEMLGAVSKGHMSMEQLKELGSIVKDIADTTELAELTDRLESIEASDKDDGSDDFSDNDLIQLEDYQSISSMEEMTEEQKEKFPSTASNAVLIGKHAAKHSPLDKALLDVEDPK